MPRMLADDELHEVDLNDQPHYASDAGRRIRGGEDRASHETIVPAPAAPSRSAARTRIQPPPPVVAPPRGRSVMRCLMQIATFVMYGVSCFLLGVHFSGYVPTSLKSAQTTPYLGAARLCVV